jgi:hypothetical protein
VDSVAPLQQLLHKRKIGSESIIILYYSFVWKFLALSIGFLFELSSSYTEFLIAIYTEIDSSCICDVFYQETLVLLAFWFLSRE